MGMMAGEWAQAPGRPRRPLGWLRGSGPTAAHPVGRLSLSGNRAIAGLFGGLRSVQRAPGDTAPTVTPIFGGTGAQILDGGIGHDASGTASVYRQPLVILTSRSSVSAFGR